MKQTDISGPIDLFKKSLNLYFKAFPAFVGISLISLLPLVFQIVLSGDNFLFKGKLISYLQEYSFSFFVNPLILAISQSAFIVLIITGGKRGLIYSFKKGLKYVLPLFWVEMLSRLASFAGLFLLIVPGIIFFVWYYFSIYVLVEEGVGGFQALKQSRNYTQGRWLLVFRRIGFILIPTFLLSLAIAFISLKYELGIWFLLLANLPLVVFWSPISVIYGYFLYQNLKNTQVQPKKIKNINCFKTHRRQRII